MTAAFAKAQNTKSTDQAASLAGNPFISEWNTPFQVPPFDKIRNEHFLPAFQEGIRQQRSEIEAIVKNPKPPTFQNTCQALDQSGKLLEKVSSVFYGLNSANTNAELQEIAKQVSPLVTQQSDDISMNAKLFARLAPRGAVYAFETSEYARSVMVPAVAVSGLKNITLIPMGLSDAPGEMVLHTPIKRRGGVGFGLAHLGADDGARDMVDQTVRLTTLDAFAAARGLTRVDFIKADIEGWELQALRGGAQTLARFKPALYLEVDDECLVRANATPADLWALLEPMGYKARTTPGLLPVTAYQGAGDYLFVAKD